MPPVFKAPQRKETGMKKIWNWFVLKSFKFGFARGKYYMGTREEAFKDIRVLLGEEAMKKAWEDIQFDVKGITFSPIEPNHPNLS